MQPCYVVEIVTPKKVVLNGLWFGPKRPKHVVIWVHGLGSSMFKKQYIVNQLIDGKTAVLVFNNRGFEKIARVSRVKGASFEGGAAHEKFTDCVDDIQGAVNFSRKMRVRSIFIAGHSTGCQKSIYWAHKRGNGVRGVIILGPVSDYSAERMLSGLKKIQRAAKVAREYVRGGKKDALLPEHIWGKPWTADAQRFISLYSGNSPEEIFTYWDPKRNPRTLRSIKKPILVLLAEKDEYADRPAKKIAAWFDVNIRAPHKVVIIPRVKHSFRGGEKHVAAAIRKFIKKT